MDGCGGVGQGSSLHRGDLLGLDLLAHADVDRHHLAVFQRRALLGIGAGHAALGNIVAVFLVGQNGKLDMQGLQQTVGVFRGRALQTGHGVGLLTQGNIDKHLGARGDLLANARLLIADDACGPLVVVYVGALVDHQLDVGIGIRRNLVKHRADEGRHAHLAGNCAHRRSGGLHGAVLAGFAEDQEQQADQRQHRKRNGSDHPDLSAPFLPILALVLPFQFLFPAGRTLLLCGLDPGAARHAGGAGVGQEGKANGRILAEFLHVLEHIGDGGIADIQIGAHGVHGNLLQTRRDLAVEQ